jgi:putative sigma-54 modulation protein
MNIDFVARNVHLDDKTREYAEAKLAKLGKFLEEPMEVRVTLEVAKHHHVADLHVAHRFGVLQAKETTEGILDAINFAVDKVEKQARRSRKKFLDRRRKVGRVNGGSQWPLEVLAPEGLSQGTPPKVVKTTSIQIKPMTIEEAALTLERSRNDFLVFHDSTSDRVNVLYKRRDENYGLITPEF